MEKQQVNIGSFSIDQLKSLLYDLTKEHDRVSQNIKIAEAVLETKVKAEQSETKKPQIELPLGGAVEDCSNGKCSERVGLS